MHLLVRLARVGFAVGVVGVVGAPACASSSELRAVERGDRAALGAALAGREAAHTPLSTGQALALATAVARRELEVSGASEAVARIHELAPCARELDDALAARMRTHDAAGGAAALARVESRGLGFGDVRQFAVDPQGSWRAAGARGLTRRRDRDERVHALMDPEPGVRREAARASRDAGDPDDELLLAQAARVDPEPLVRTEAVRAIAVMRPDRRIVDALRDLWSAGDDGVREDIARAWCSDALWGVGGRDAVRIVIASDHDAGAVEAAAAALRRADRDPEIRGEAIGRLVAAIASGARATRLQAIVEAPLDPPELRTAIEAAGEPDQTDVALRVAALGRLAAAHQDGARSALEELARPPDSGLSASARFALALAGDRRAQAWVEDDLSAPSPDRRVDAAVGLGALGVPSRAAPLLADPDAGVRSRAACAMIVAGRTAR